MTAIAFGWAEEAPTFAAADLVARTPRPNTLPASVDAALWRATELGQVAGGACASGWPILDAELPAGGWPCGVVTELLQPQPGVCEWRLLGPVLSAITGKGKDVVLIGPPRALCASGIAQYGVDERRLVWIRAEAPAERLWSTEQLVKAGSAGAVVAWLPQARPEHLRRLQTCSRACTGPVFVCRPLAASHEASAAPLRAVVELGEGWAIDVRLVKRRGAAHERPIALQAMPGALSAALAPRHLCRGSGPPSALDDVEGAMHAVGRSDAARRRQRATAA